MKPSAFANLVAQMRASEKKYWQGGRQHNDLLRSIDYESQVDKEIKRTADFLALHPESQPSKDKPEWKFFCLVTVLRKNTREYFDRKKKHRQLTPQQQLLAKDELKELWTSVIHYEAEVDKYLQRLSDAAKRAQGYIITFQVIRSRARMSEPQVMLSTSDEHYANVECYDLNTKSRDGSIYSLRRIEQPPSQPQQQQLSFQ